MRKTLLLMAIAAATAMAPAPAQAVFAPVEVEWTGTVSGKNDQFGYTPSQPFSYMGGSMANNSLGGAFQFTVKQFTHVDAIFMDAVVKDFDSEILEHSDFTFKIYRGSQLFRDTDQYIPNTADVLAMASVHLTDALARDQIYTQYNVAIAADLDEGTYWLARERQGGDRNAIVMDIKTDFASLHNPEPATAFLMGGGLLAMLRRRKKQ